MVRPYLAAVTLCSAFCLLGTSFSEAGSAQTAFTQPAAPMKHPKVLIDGFEITIDANATTKELARQKNLWMMEVTFKSMRMRWVEVTDPKTGKKQRETIWYLVYKAVPRPTQQRQDEENRVPKNVEDTVVPSLFVPHFVLKTTDGTVQKIYHDSIIPEAQADILQHREKRYKRQPYLKNTVQAIGPLPEAVPVGGKEDNAIYGIVTWRGIDPKTDFFEIYMSGFSNGYLKKNGLEHRKTIVQKYKRPGDEFFQGEAEIARDGDPNWIDWPSKIVK